jgi:dienelactone hydrolase
MIREKYTSTFDIEIAPPLQDGKKYPIVLLIHGNFGLVGEFGKQLRNFTEEIGALGYLAALPSYYPAGVSNRSDTNIDLHVPAITAAVKHLSLRSDADVSRLGLVGFSLGGGIAMAYINSLSKGDVLAFADFYGYVAPKLGDGVAKFPPTIIFHNEKDPLVRVKENSEPLADALAKEKISHEPKPPYVWFADDWEAGGLHAFEPGGAADIESRKSTKRWLTTHLPPDGK